VIHYAAPNGQLYPFCTYNSGPEFREKIEREFSVPVETLAPMRCTVDVRAKVQPSASEEQLVPIR
jgi:hypothetical protein